MNPARAPDPTDIWLNEQVREIRRRITPRDEASLWTLFFDDLVGEPLIALATQDAMHYPTAEWLPGLARILEEVGASAHLIAVIRQDGRPRPEDRQMWRDLQALLPDRRRQDVRFMVVGPHACWCVAQEAPPAA